MLWSAGAATLIVTGFCILRSPREEPAGLPVAEHGVTSPTSPGLVATPLGVGVDREDNRPASMVPATRASACAVGAGGSSAPVAARRDLGPHGARHGRGRLRCPRSGSVAGRRSGDRPVVGPEELGGGEPVDEGAAGVRDQVPRRSGQIAVVLTKADPAAAQQWVEALEAGPSREAAVESMATELALAYPEQAIRLAEELAPGGTREQTVTHVFSQWSASGSRCGHRECAQHPGHRVEIQRAVGRGDIVGGQRSSRRGPACGWGNRGRGDAESERWFRSCSDGPKKIRRPLPPVSRILILGTTSQKARWNNLSSNGPCRMPMLPGAGLLCCRTPLREIRDWPVSPTRWRSRSRARRRSARN